MNRAERRARERALKKERKKNKDLNEKMGMFDKLPDHCLSCLKAFDKKDKTMVMSWSVVVREKQGIVRLYCPDCWKMAADVMEALKNEDNNNST